jgi:transaldolase/glucose-6-phosphate isomerase
MKSVQTAQNPLKQALQYGQSLWYDGLVSKEEFAKLVREDGVRGATTNPSILEKAISSGVYDSEIKTLAKTLNDEQIYQTLAVKAVQETADQFKPVYEEARGQDGFVSIEVSPLLAYETQKTIEEGKLLHKLVGRKNIMIKVPATKQGLPAIEALTAEGICVNVTLIFSLSRYKEVMNAYLSGLEKRVAAGNDISAIASVASFFVSRVDSSVDKELESKNNAPQLVGKIGIANSKAAYQEFLNVFGSARFEKLKAKGAHAQRPLWASTGTKNPKYSDVLYVEALMGENTVNTIPPPTMDAFRDHGVAGARLKEGMSDAQKALKELSAAGINLDQITQTLEDQGVQLFSDAHKKLLSEVAARKK